MADLEIKVENLAAVQKFLSTIAVGVKDLRPALQEASEWYLTQIDSRFATESDADGNKWAPLSEKYRRAKAKAGGINKILQFRGRLRKIRYQVYRDRVEIGSNLPYAKIHEMGGTIRQYARSRQVEFKVNKSGRSRFAKKGKGNFSQPVTYGESTRKISQRSFLRPSASDELRIGQIIVDRLGTM